MRTGRWAAILTASLGLLGCGSRSAPPAALRAGGDVATTPSGPSVDVARFGARCNGRDVDSAAIQAAIDSLGPGGGDVVFPEGTCLVDAVAAPIQLRSRTRLLLGRGTVLRAVPNGSRIYEVIRGIGVSGAAVRGGTIVGDRDAHTGTEGEWGNCIYLGAVSDVTIEDVTVRDCWGDGLTVGAAEPRRGTLLAVSRRVTVRRSTFDHNRRNGISVTGAAELTIESCAITNTGGTSPQGGIDFESDDRAYPNTGARVAGVTMHGNVTSIWFGGAANVDILVQGGRFRDAHGLAAGRANRNLRIVGADVASVGGPSGFGFRLVVDDASVDGLEVEGSTFTADTAGVIVDIQAPGSHGRFHGNVITTVAEGSRALRVTPSDFVVDHNVIRVERRGGLDARSADDWTHTFGAGVQHVANRFILSASSPRRVFGVPAPRRAPGPSVLPPAAGGEDEYLGGYGRGYEERSDR